MRFKSCNRLSPFSTLASLFFILLLFHPPLANAQAQTGTIAGTVQDAGGSILVSAKITIEPIGRQAATNDQGQFRIADLPPGDYTLTASYIGFATFTIDPGTTFSALSRNGKGITRQLSIPQNSRIYPGPDWLWRTRQRPAA